MNNIVSVKLDSRYASTLGYGSMITVRCSGRSGTSTGSRSAVFADREIRETLSRVGTTVDGVTEVKIPDELLTHSATSNYRIMLIFI